MICQPQAGRPSAHAFIFAVFAAQSGWAQTPVTDPLPDPIPDSSLTARVVPLAQPANTATRLNGLTPRPDGSGRLFVHSMTGELWSMQPDGSDVTLFFNASALPDFTSNGGQRGLVSVAFHPDFADPTSDGFGKLYTVTSHTIPGPFDFGGPVEADFNGPLPRNAQGNTLTSYSHHDVLTEWSVADPAANTFSGTRREVLRISQPYNDHNMGQIAFNPTAQPNDLDYGRLYIAMGDGGNKFPIVEVDPVDNGQGMHGLGGILRIDPLDGDGVNGQYGAPADNPWNAPDATDAQKLYYANGLRNPHRFSWDPVTGKMLISDIGQGFIEEINLGEAGANYGWGLREGVWKNDQGLYPYQPGDPFSFKLSQAMKAERIYAVQPGDDEADFGAGVVHREPVAMYAHSQIGGGGVAVAGGFVYRGTAIPQLIGQYLFGDFPSGQVFHVPVDELVQGQQAQIARLGLFDQGLNPEADLRGIMGLFGSTDRPDFRFGVDAAGELYLTSKADGRVYRLAATVGDVNSDLAYDLGDVSAFIAALASDNDRAAFETAHPDWVWDHADLTGDGVVDNLDIDPFVSWLALAGHGSPAAIRAMIPEPTTLILLTPIALATRRRRHDRVVARVDGWDAGE